MSHERGHRRCMLRVFPRALPGDAVQVQNYRRGGRPEPGTVVAVEARITEGQTQMTLSYTVLLDRKSAAGRALYLTVGHEEFYRTNKKEGTP